MTLAPTEPGSEGVALAWREQQVFAARMRATRPRVTQALLVFLGLVFALEMAWGGAGSTAVLARMGAMTRQRLFAGEWWRLMSSSVLHGGLLHVSLNGYVLWILGRGTEQLFGSARFLILYVASALAGALGSAVFLGGLSVGASGAIWGLLGAQAVLAFRARGYVPELVRPLLKKAAATNLALNVVVSFVPHVDWAAHFTGGACGALLVSSGLLLRGLPRLEEPDPAPGAGRRARALAVALGGLYVAGAVFGLVAGKAWELRRGALYVERVLPELGASASLPELVGEGSPEREEGRTAYAFGDESGPLRIAIQRLTLPPSRIAGALDLEREHAELRQELSRVEEGLELVTPPATVRRAGRLVTEARSRFAWGAWYDVAFLIEPPHVWKIEILTWPDWAERYAGALAHVVTSLRDLGAGLAATPEAGK